MHINLKLVVKLSPSKTFLIVKKILILIDRDFYHRNCVLLDCIDVPTFENDEIIIKLIRSVQEKLISTISLYFFNDHKCLICRSEIVKDGPFIFSYYLTVSICKCKFYRNFSIAVDAFISLTQHHHSHDF